MAFKCGFFDSINGDRLYSAEQMNKPYERLVSNGIFAQRSGSASNDFQVLSNGNMTVTVKKGQGIFFNKWSELDADMIINVVTSHLTLPRIDSIVVRIDNSLNVRAGSVEYKQGTPASNPEAPSLVRTDSVYEYRLANILVEAGTTSILQTKITDTRASDECGFVTHLLQQADISATYVQWQAQFDEWFQHLRETVSTATLIRSFTSKYVTTVQDETVIPIGIDRYTIETDILQVYINGLILIEDQDYTVNDYETVTLTKGLDIGATVSFIVYKSVDGSEAESIVGQVDELYERLDIVKPVGNTGGAKYTVPDSQNILDYFKTLPSGLCTLYASSSVTGQPTSSIAYRYVGHVTVSRGDTSIGWLMAYRSNGQVYSNFLNAGTWSGWKELSNSTQITADNGGVKIEVASGESVLTAFQNAGTGFHTMYSASGALDTPTENVFRYFGHMTGSSNGYIYGIKTNGSVYVNYDYAGEWSGWRVLYEYNPSMLWEGALYMNASANVVPSKTLAECQHGWVLVWSDYDAETSTKNQYNVVTCYVPKKNAVGNNWNGSSFMCTLPVLCREDGTFEFTCKQVYIYNDHITGFAGNNVGDLNKGVVLSAIYEY